MVEDISHEGLLVLLREEGVSFQRLKTWKHSRDPDYEAKTNRILHLYGLMDGTVDALPGDPDVVLCLDEIGPLNLQPYPGAAVGQARWRRRGPAPAAPRDLHAPARGPAPIRRLRPVSRQLYGHVKPRKRRGEFLGFLRYVRTLYPPEVRIAIVLDNYSPHLSTRDDPRVGVWAAATTWSWATPQPAPAT